jgi:intracellular septation protein
MGILNLIIAFNFPTDVWVNFKLFGGMGLMLVFVLARACCYPNSLRKKNNALRHHR